jgi:hypothetical protein
MSEEAPTLYLSVDSLCSKWGFHNGDEPDYLLDYWQEQGLGWGDFGEGWHGALRKLVRSHLVPAMEAAGHTVEVYDIETIHNPIRAATIDGNSVDERSGVVPVEELRCEGVTVAYEDIARACGLPFPGRLKRKEG